MPTTHIDPTPVIRKLDSLRREYGTDAAVATVLGVDHATISNVRAGRRNPSRALLIPLGFEKVVTFRKARHE